MNFDVEFLGQVFTPPQVARQMLALRRNQGRVLEPSAGLGIFSDLIPGCVALEKDARLARRDALVMDFFSYPQSEIFDTIIGNPPYVRHQSIAESTRALLDSQLFDARSNLYLFFIEKCVRHLRAGGELIFIVPREFTKLTAARRLNEFLFAEGTITDFMETGDSGIFGEHTPNCAIFRFERGCFDRRLTDGRCFGCVNGQLLFSRSVPQRTLADFFEVRVGAVSGANDVFAHPGGNADFVCSQTNATGNVRRMIFNEPHPSLLTHKERLLARRIRRFDESNWWQWGRLHHVSPAPRLYVNAKTRRAQPFFAHPCCNYDGSVLALFPKSPATNLQRAAQWLNDCVDWRDLGFVCDGRYLFAQRSLQHAPLPQPPAALRLAQL